MHLLLWAEDSEAELRSEIAQSIAAGRIHAAGAPMASSVPPAAG